MGAEEIQCIYGWSIVIPFLITAINNDVCIMSVYI